MSAYSDAILADSPLLYLRLDETSGATCANAGSLGGNATANGTFTRNVAAHHANLSVAVNLNGTVSDYISYPDTAALRLIADFTYEAWVKPSSYVAQQHIMGKGSSATSLANGYGLRINTDRKVAILATGITLLFTSTGAIPNDGAWHHVAATRSGNNYTVYIDGASAGTATNTATTPSASTRTFKVGVQDANGTISSPLTGDVDEVAVYNTALSSTQIAAHYAAATATSTTYNGSATVSLTDTVTAAGKRTTYGTATVAAAVTVTTAGSAAATVHATATVAVTVAVTSNAVAPTIHAVATLNETVTITTRCELPAFDLEPHPIGSLVLTPADSDAFVLTPLPELVR